MEKVFYEVNSLDKKCYDKLALTEDILMEHAASSIADFIEDKFEEKVSVLIVAGPGNNGADGIALARLLYKKYDVKLYLPFGAKSQMARIQLQRAELLGVPFVQSITSSDIIVDCLFGSGLNKDLDETSLSIINSLNEQKAYKIACDIPSGVNIKGQINQEAFFADVTVTMGALKVALFLDEAKDYVGKVKVANLGVQRTIYEEETNIYLLDKEDMKLPFRSKKNAHKGSFGHLNVIAGCKKGAGVIAAKAAFGFGTGLVSVVSHEDIDLPYHIMQTHFLSDNCTAIAIGMGLGKYEKDEIKKILEEDIPTVVDADLFYEEVLLDKLQKDVVLTPHPKEFVALLKLCDIANISVKHLQKNRFEYVEKFCKKYPNTVLLLKGANTLIGKADKIYINSFGTAILSKGGSGDVLSGLVASLLAQEYNSLDAAITASLAHAIAANNYKKANYSLIPADLVEEIRRL
ncbi:bifunctional ADP-dependent NAD(P)H-hydrate dehydratase/NAD(P)H-hydrate epimerase [Halarcobacter mediterraneus]|uniref:Bifunctional NAD(P)H-hydrate repair enzyme n=1 Tax=Halarcobacter mediterraneus TaxID=2023153 RepID=A0A4Q1AS72_9BACT|nr:NAD(P)H-hydrate dehydratase [Halarcobacter mediterraneus]RXK12533.1 bifunctional ADP-dependent NAD(P)H-hydrate dehydratase/NAD(P)H-hydrate epimerase [Halarcobacter mediterraneus]